MMKRTVFLATACFAAIQLSAQVTNPIITSWKINTTGHTVTPPGGSPILTDVAAVYYDSSDVYIKSSGVPSYYSFSNGNVNAASDGHFTFNFPLNPQPATNHASTLTGGQIGELIDGSLFFNPEDARSYQNANVWHQLAYYFEGTDFDTSWGHSTPTNVYHHHVVSKELCDITDSTHHSPLIGFAFDGYPVYGPYGYSDPNDANSPIKRMKPSWQKRNISQRTTLPDNTALQPSQYGPAINTQYPLGCYREDYEFVSNSGDLDTYNGRFCKTPEYPNGTYAYFATVDDALVPVYPEFVGQSFYGVIDHNNLGPNGGQSTVPANATQYSPTTGITDEKSNTVSFYPNPTTNLLQLKFGEQTFVGDLQVSDITGRVLLKNKISGASVTADVSLLPEGTYILSVTNSSNGNRWSSPFVKQ